MPAPNTTNWIRVGLLALPVYGVLTFWTTLDPQPDSAKDPEAWARFVGSNSYLVDHIFGAIGGAVLAILGVFALGTYLATSRAGRLGLAAMVITVVGHALGLAIGGVSTFASNAMGRAYLAGMKDVSQVQYPSAMMVTFGVAILLMFVGSVLLGVAVWRSGTLPKWAGAVWVASALLFYVLGAVLGMATTGSSLPTQPVGALLIAIGGGWMAWSALRRPSSAGVAGAATQPRVQQ
jgi:hypothetical protein